MDYSKLRAAALEGAETEEAVTVDTRALIDKVLARYSGEWTTLRELIQNAADARATTVSVKWETLPSTQIPTPSSTSRSESLKHVLTNHTLSRLVVQNDGQPFTKTDWARLKRIAEGNPDETKIGAFGVGFYSVFADCEEPFVSSGDQAMAFYWKGNALFTKKSTLPSEQSSPYTTFILDYRNTTTPLPNLLSVSQFLATSLTFVALENVEFWIDDYQILSLKKKSSPQVELTLPRDLETTTKEGLMRVVSVDRTSTQIDASYMRAVGWRPQAAKSVNKSTDSYNTNEGPSLKSFFARLTASASQSSMKAKIQQEETAAQVTIADDVTKLSSSTIFLRATSASIKTSVSASFAAELERATKKPPPKTTKLSILTSSYDEVQASEASKSDTAINKAADVFASVLPSRKAGGRIFIGFPTMQTTGAGMHVSAPSVIPTVEREAIDLNARWVRTWNVELLRATGIITRLAFANEMDDLRQKLKRFTNKGEISPDVVSKFLPEAIHNIKTFTFDSSTPSAQVGQIVEEAFWTCFKRASIEMYSSVGVLPTTDIRLGTQEVAKFVSKIPVLLPETTDLSFVKKLVEFGLISHVNVTDIKKELESKALQKSQLFHFINWVAKKAATGELDPGSRSLLLEVAIAELEEDGTSGGIIALGSIKNFLTSNAIPKHLPVPPTTIPYAFTANCSSSELQALGWQPLEIVPWLRFLLETESSQPLEHSITKNAGFAVQILVVLSKSWDAIGVQQKETVLNLLRSKTVMPTRVGMRVPSDSFFPSVQLFDDLPVIEGCGKVKEKFLVAIGVRKTLDLETIFTRLLHASDEKGQKKWSHKELIVYLASVRADIPDKDLKKLRESKFCPAEDGPDQAEWTKASEKLYRVSELFEPKASLRTLGLPVLQWPSPAGTLRAGSPEASFLTSLGLRLHPSAPELVGMMASKDKERRSYAMQYFIANHQTNLYFKFSISTTQEAIIPIQGSTRLVRPSECFWNDNAAILGFDILTRELQAHASKFGVAQNPTIDECINRLLANPPRDHEDAVKMFGYFASRAPDMRGVINRLRGASIVPVMRRLPEKSSTLTFITPERTYLGTSKEYGDIFDFVDFGQAANAFLFQCGAKSEPSKLEIASEICKEPARMLSILQTPEKYLALLKSLAEVTSLLQKDKELWRRMKMSPFLLAYHEISRPKEQSSDHDEEDAAPMRQYQLASAREVVVVDDFISYQLFKEHLKCAPEDNVLEDFYQLLGAESLSRLVQEDVRVGSASGRADKAFSLKKHIIERSKLFLHEYVSYQRNGAKHDAKWLENNLGVEVVRSLALRRTLKGQTRSHTEKRSAASTHDRSTGWTLYVADDGTPDMYQVGQALCQMILHRPNQQAYLFFEPFLTLDLYGLRTRGYNVDRILRAKAAEARIAEEERRKALEEEQRRIKEAENQWDQGNHKLPEAAGAARQEPPPPEPLMPGSWNSPERAKGDKTDRKGKSLFSNLSRRFGFNPQEDDDHEAEKQLQNFVDNSTAATPPPSTTAGPSGVLGPAKTKDDGRVTNPALVQQNLLEAVNRTKAHGSNQLRSQASVREVKEQSNYCDETPSTNITFIASASNGVKVYISKDVDVESSKFLTTNFSSINLFAGLLAEIGNVYSISPSSLHIFYDEVGPCIAFNTNGSLFCNFRFFLQLHADQLAKRQSGSARAEAGTWWWVVLAHELAHNLVSLHNAEHSYYTESFIQQFMGKMMLKCAQWTQSGQQRSEPSRSSQDMMPRPSILSTEPPPPYKD